VVLRVAERGSLGMTIAEIDKRLLQINRRQLDPFLFHFTEAWLRADQSNKVLLKPVMDALFKKYPYVFQTATERRLK